MKFYAYKGNAPLGTESLGTDGRDIFYNLKTVRGVVNRITKWYKWETFTIYSFDNFYDDKTFRKVFSRTSIFND